MSPISKLYFKSTFFLFVFLISLTAFSQTTVTFTTGVATTSLTGSWTVPCGITSVTIQCIGGGGGGGAGNGSNKDGGGGGGGGGCAVYNAIAVTPGATYNYTVGQGGLGGIGAQAAFAGGASKITIGAVTVTGNGGGFGARAPSGTFGAGGTAVNGTSNSSGGNGAAGSSGNYCGGGGEGASPGVAGAAAITSSGGTGTAGADGGNGGTSNTYGWPTGNGFAPGGGGSGGSRGGDGSDGGNGQIRIIYDDRCPISTGIYPTATQFVCVGNAATTLSTSVCGGTAPTTILYQWYYNTTNSNTIAGATLVAGATSFSYTPLSTIAELGTRYYFCVAYATNNGCTQTNATQSLASNAVQISVTNVPPTAAAAGSNTTICNGSSATLAANTPGVGSGSWSIVSGPSLSLSQFSNISSPSAVFTPAGGPVTYTLRWTINNGGCTSTSDLIVTVNCGGACPACTAYTHPTVGIAGEFVGSCEVALCSGTYYDSGGSAGNYANDGADGAGYYRVFCPNTAGQCLTATFTSFNVDATDALTVGNGSTQNSPALFSGSGSAIPGPFTGSANGCLSFRFNNSSLFPAAGWAANFSCAPCAGAPTGLANSDCRNATQLCSSASITGLTTGPGVSAEACGGGGCPAGGENHTSWFAVSIKTAGTFLFSIVPVTGTDDFDYAVYGGAGVNCNNLGASIRCSDSGSSGTTGLSAGAVDLTESVTGDKFTAPINAVAGDTYYIMVDSWTPPTTGYALNFSGTAEISCVLLPIELLSFTAKYDVNAKVVNLDWETASETNNQYFEVQRSLDGNEFEKIDVVLGAGNSTAKRNYHTIDKNATPDVLNYYRLKQVDNDGQFTYSKIEAVAFNDFGSQIRVQPNPSHNVADIVFSSQTEGVYHLNILDYTGRLLISTEIKSVKGKNIIPLNLDGFPDGVHFLTLQGEGEFFKTSFIKE